MADKDRARDRDENPATAAFTPDFSDDPPTGLPSRDDTGTQSWVPDFSDYDSDSDSDSYSDSGSEDSGPRPRIERTEEAAHGSVPTDAPGAPETEAETVAESAGGPLPVTVPGRYIYLKWWKLLLVIVAVWFAAVEVGLGLLYWWYHSANQTAALFVVLVYVVSCVVGAVMLAMVQGRPLVSALSIALLSAPFASLVAAAPLYGYYHCARVGHCLLGVLPY